MDWTIGGKGSCQNCYRQRWRGNDLPYRRDGKIYSRQIEMKTIILPGYSKHNCDWAEEMVLDMDLVHEVVVHNWKHWEKGNFSLKQELERILEEVGDGKINIIAKSVGVYVALNLIPKILHKVNKVILCGIASAVGEDRKGLLKTFVSSIPVENILCIQNEKDKYVTFADAEKFYHSVEPKIKVISKPRSDHDYPYPGDFKKFLG
jgi:predicted alpha/beta hydrolase family esterase